LSHYFWAVHPPCSPSQFHPQFLPCILLKGQPRAQITIAKAIRQDPDQQWHALIIIQDYWIFIAR
jgi:hypothetical protein